MKLFDTHCDTAYSIEKRQIPFDNDSRHIRKSDLALFEKYEQMFAIWSRNASTPEENWEHFFTVKAYFEKEIKPLSNEHFVPHLAIEGSALLNGKLERLQTLHDNGVRMMTLVWKNECCMGGAHNTSVGLTDFGKQAVKEMFRLGIVPDVSHASDQMIYDTLEIAFDKKKPICASHSNSRTVTEHTRNLTDELFKDIVKTNGLVGINLCREFTQTKEVCTLDWTLKHVSKFLELGGEHNICMGTDFDGITRPPDGIDRLADIGVLYELLIKEFGQKIADDIFYNNASRFFTENKLL